MPHSSWYHYSRQWKVLQIWNTIMCLALVRSLPDSSAACLWYWDPLLNWSKCVIWWCRECLLLHAPCPGACSPLYREAPLLCCRLVLSVCACMHACVRACMLACGSTFMHGFTSWFVHEPVFTVSCHLYAHLVQGGLNAMHLAAAGGYIEIIKFLRPMFGTRVHEKDDFAFTPLHWAAQMGHCQVARYLIEELNMIPQDRDMVCGVLRGNV